MADKRIGKRVKFERKGGKGSDHLDDLFRIFYEAKVAEGIADGTLLMYREGYDLFRGFLELKVIPLRSSEITADHLRSYQTWMLKEKIRFDGHKFKTEKEQTVGVSPVTVNTRTKSMRTMFRFLHKEGLIEDNPWLNVTKVREPEKEIQIMTETELNTLINTPDKRSYAGFRDYVLLTLLIDAFLRINEALSIRVSDIDFGLGMVRVEASVSKTRRERWVPIGDRTQKLLKELIEECSDFQTEYVFNANYGGRLTDDQFRNRLRVHAKEAGLSIRVHPHLFRHTAATLFLEGGGDIRHLAKILGHVDLRMVTKYTHLSKKALKNQHEKYSPLNNVVSKLQRERKILR